MSKNRKVQVTLESAVYERLCEIAEHEGKSLAGVVRESVVRYCIEPAARQQRVRAIDRLVRVGAAIPDDYADWEREYSGIKAQAHDDPGSADDDAR